jgi:hypothetical protein
VATKNERYQAKDKSWKERLVGYEYRHVMKVDFDYSPMRGDMLMRLSEAECAPDGYDMDIEPDDVAESDTVTVVWRIE